MKKLLRMLVGTVGVASMGACCLPRGGGRSDVGDRYYYHTGGTWQPGDPGSFDECQSSKSRDCSRDRDPSGSHPRYR